MKVLILAGGFGTRFSEETDLKPKPMIEIGGRPILWHIMKIYSRYGFNDFVILLGYKGYIIKEFFSNYFLYQSDIEFDMSKNEMKIINNNTEPWRITLLETGLNTMTGGRIKRAQDIVGNNPFMLTYGDGVSNVDITKLLSFHQSHGKSLTMTTIQPEGRFGSIQFNSDTNKVSQFLEKPKGDGNWINGGFFVCQPTVFDYIKEGDNSIWERQPMEDLAKDGELYCYKHDGFWSPMDTLKDKLVLTELWDKNRAAWKIW